MQDKHRLKRLKQLLKSDGREDEHGILPEIEEEWCSFHYLVQSAIHQVADACMVIIVSEICSQFCKTMLLARLFTQRNGIFFFFADDEILSSLHRFRPKILVASNGIPSYYEPYEYWHACDLSSEQNGDADALVVNDDDQELDNGIRKCTAVPFVSFSHFRMSEVTEKLATVVKEVDIWFVISVYQLTSS